jgi:glycosyltransferase involved in cell wall biosynthesis
MSEAAPLFSVVVPSRGAEAKLLAVFDALAGQTLPRDRFEVVVALDGAVPTVRVEQTAARLGATLVRVEPRSGPGAARNRAAARAGGEFLAFTEDDVRPASDWLERAAARLAADPTLDVLEGATLKPGGRPVRVLGAEGALYLPANLFVRRALFSRVGGYCEAFFDRERGLYFREDSDLGFTLEEAGARIASASEVCVTHPEEHAGFLDPLRWARRYEMDALLARRHPRLFRERVEVHRLGPLRVRRPIVRAAWVCVLATVGALVAPLLGRREMALPLGILAAAAFLPIWAKWRFGPLRLPVALVAPFVLVGSLVRGWVRVRTGVLR